MNRRYLLTPFNLEDFPAGVRGVLFIEAIGYFFEADVG